MFNDNIVILGILFLLYSNGTISLTQLLLLLALQSTTNYCCNCADNYQTI
ncbi:MAG: hypothetical protein IJB32_00600 [Clostridia bacterium]|nr:hypothetical protein [Clostridia bacterium]